MNTRDVRGCKGTVVATSPRDSMLFLLGDGGPKDLLPPRDLLHPRDLLPLRATAQLLRKDHQPDQPSCKSFQKGENASSQK